MSEECESQCFMATFREYKFEELEPDDYMAADRSHPLVWVYNADSGRWGSLCVHCLEDGNELLKSCREKSDRECH